MDSIKHISGFVSSDREVLPGRDYFIPNTMEKLNPLTINYTDFEEKVLAKPLPVGKALYTSLTGLSPLIGNEICGRASIDAGISTSALSETEQLHLYGVFSRLMEDVAHHDFKPVIIYNGKDMEATCVH